MPDLKRSPGMADIDVCHGKHQAGYSALEQALKESEWVYRNGEMVRRSPLLDPKRLSDFLPSDGNPDEPTSMRNVASPNEQTEDDVPMHGGFESIQTPPLRPSVLERQSSGLPPTPPTRTNSDGAEAIHDHPSNSPLIFADGVRNALHSQKSGTLTTTPVNQHQSPPTPNPSPPQSTVDVYLAPAMQQIEKPDFVQPMIASSLKPPPLLRQYPSSRAESFQTAREDQPPTSDASSILVSLSEADTLPRHWLDATRELQLAATEFGDVVAIATPRQPHSRGDVEAQSTASTTPRRPPRHTSPVADDQGDADWEKHISYISGPDELDDLRVSQHSAGEPAIGLGVSAQNEPLHKTQAYSEEDANNRVYKHIQEQNAKRHSIISDDTSAMRVGIVVPSANSTPHTLKRHPKCRSLRGDRSSESKRGSIDAAENKLKHKKARLPERRALGESPVVGLEKRFSSLPARLVPPTISTGAGRPGSPRDMAQIQRGMERLPDTKHKLRHLSYGDRLSYNKSVRRTSLEVPSSSPTSGLAKSSMQDGMSLRQSSAPGKITHNMAVRRSGMDTEDLNQYGKPHARDALHPSSSKPKTSTPGKLRHFSRQERLENNSETRRTSLDVPRYFADAAAAHVYLEKFVLPTSPRKTLDPRHLNPIETPMSVSAQSDRTDVELCEASGIRLYPHKNQSLLLVQQSARNADRIKESFQSDRSASSSRQPLNRLVPVFAAEISPPTPIIAQRNLVSTVDSPLTNPRSAPAPPVLVFIPPTPSEELDRELEEDGNGHRSEDDPPQRRLSLLQKARRYSDDLLIRTGSVRRAQKQRQGSRVRDRYLSPSWRPQGFWEEFDSDDELDDFETDYLPRGGDTSDVGDDEKEERRRSVKLFPRLMSKRLPGFRGTGGFLIGNSLGLDRHGTNNRGHYVSTGSRTLSKRQSEEFFATMQADDSSHTRPSKASQRQLVKVSGRPRGFITPFSGGVRARLLGAQGFRGGMLAMSTAREEREREKRREKLRGSIGYRVYHEH